MIAIIAAMDIEVEAITSIMSNVEQLEKSGVSFFKGTIHERPLLVMKSGVGKVNASMSTTILLERFSIDRVVNIGTAGGLNPTQNILDAVISDDVVQHDFDTSPVDGKEGIRLRFTADKDVADVCERSLHALGVTVHRGLVASGDQFIARVDQLDKLAENFPEAICAEMEAGAIAQVCAHYQVPFVVLRSLSDITHKENSHMDFCEYAKQASKRSADFTREFMKLSAL
ncbi:5'-methylthioadenosine/adenosylhomocysteine nucleosidase [Amedibacillus sp. YH-ame10]